MTFFDLRHHKCRKFLSVFGTHIHKHRSHTRRPTNVAHETKNNAQTIYYRCRYIDCGKLLRTFRFTAVIGATLGKMMQKRRMTEQNFFHGWEIQ